MACPEVIAVSATDNLDQISCASSTGSEVELAGPGVNVNTTALGGVYTFASNSSVASTHVAGTAALVLNSCALVDLDGDTDIDNVDARLRLQNTAEDIGHPPVLIGYGLLAVGTGYGSTTQALTSSSL